MPQYLYQCPVGHKTTKFLALANHQPLSDCGTCGVLAEQVITAPLLVKAAQDVCYDSPITGAPVTSWAQRREDLAKHGCMPYDPEMKTDYTNRLKAEDAALDKTIETHVEQAIEKMATKQRNALASDILDKGQGLEYARGTAHAG